MKFSVPSFLITSVAAWLLAGSGAWAGTQILDKMQLLGSDRQTLEQTVTGLQRVRSPRRLSSGATSQLHQPDVLYEGAHFEQTFFFAQQKLTQIELVSVPEAAHAGDEFGKLLASLKAQLGPELAAGDAASWVHGDTDVVLYKYGRTDSPTVRLVIRQRQLVDAGEL